MKILHVTNNFPTLNYPIFGIFIKEQIESLRQLGISNEVFFINSREDGKIAYLKAIFRLRRFLKTNTFDIIHCHHCFSAVILILSGRCFVSPRILSYQSDPRNEGGIILFRILHRLFNRIILKNKPKELSLSKTVHLPNGVNTAVFHPMDKELCKNKLGLDPSKRYILFMDSYNRRFCKRIDRFSATLSILEEKYNYTNLEPLVLTNTGRSLIPSYINACDLHLLTSDFEGSPNSVKECIACNVPVVSTPVGNVKEMLSGIKGAYVTETFTPEELAELADKALSFRDFYSRKHIEEKGLDIGYVAGKLLQVYNSMISSDNRPGHNGNGTDAIAGKNSGVNPDETAAIRPLRVLMINNCHYRRGGADVVYLNTGDLMKSHGHSVAYFSTKSKYNYDTAFSDYFVRDVDALNMSFVEQLAYMPKKLYSMEAARKLRKLLTTFKPDVAHLHLYKGGLTASILPVLRKFGIPAVITLHDYSLLCPRNTFIDGDGRICEICLTKARINCVYKRCNRKNFYYSTINYLEFVLNNDVLKPENYFHKIICVSKFNYYKHSSHALFNERFLHLYNFYPGLSRSVPDDRKGDYFLFYGRLVAEKGVTSLIETWKRLPKDFKLKIIGGGVMSDQIVENINANDLKNIEYVGFRKDDELFSYIRNASFVLVPSEWYENNPLTIVEAYSAGKPVIGSDIGGIPELIREGETGFLFKMGDKEEFESKIKRASELNTEQYQKMSRAAYNFASEIFSEEKHYEELLKIYNELKDFGDSY